MLSENELKIIVGDRIRTLRTERGWTQIELADKMDMEATSIARIENGRLGLRLFTVYRFCRVFEISVEKFVKGVL